MFFIRPAAALIIIATLACSPKPSGPQRPASVPFDSVWVGSATEGCFLKIGKRVFKGWPMEGWDKDGAQVVEGVWELEGIARAEIKPAEITRFDGTAFYLGDAKITRVE